ncbi:MAG: pilus assembly protein N-terminal domain-containing protein, partial [Acidobacteriota bacterium]
ILILVSVPQAQQAQQVPAFAAASASAPARGPSERPTDIELLVGRSTILNVGSPITRVSLTVPDIADAMVTSPGQLLIHGKQPGTISLFIWDRGGAITTYEVTVRRDLSSLIGQMKQLFPGEPVTVVGSGKDVVISGTVSSKYVVEKAADVAGGYVEKKENVVNLLQVQEGLASNQVMLRVRFAEVSRSALQELGASFFLSKTNWAGRSDPPSVPSPSFDTDKGLVFSDFLNLFLFNSKAGLGTAIKAMQTKGLFQSLAEPNLVAIDGKEASFLAGGEFPIPVVQSGNGNNSVTILFKEFGVRLSFTPTVLGGDLVRLKVKPEVSSLDFANAVSVGGFRIPALTTRRTETEVELRDGQTFAIAGLLNNTLTNTMSKIPGIGDIPVLGKLFQSAAHQKNLTELVVMITPVILKRGQMGASEGLPALVAPYLAPSTTAYPVPEPYVGSPRSGGVQPSPRRSGTESQTLEPGSRIPDVAAEPITARPIQTPAALPQLPASTASAPALPTPLVDVPVAPPAAAPEPIAPVTTADSGTAAPAMPQEPVPAPPTKAELRALAKQRADGKKAADDAARRKVVEDKLRANEEKLQQKKAEEERREADRVAKARAAREAELARQDAETARLKAVEDQKREKVLTDAAARLKQAQSEYQAEIDKAQGSKDDKAKKTASVPQSSSRR